MRLLARTHYKKEDGFMMPALVSVMVAVSILSVAVLGVILNNFFVVGNNVKSQQAFNIAEAGINYYLWHLSHNPTDYKDGQTTPATPDPELGYGPYEHNYIDDGAINQGTYTLWIQPEGGGSTIVNVRSIGKVKGTNITRTVEAQIGAASFASYALVADTALWFGNTESASGPVHTNVGVRMDGASDSDVTSSNSTYVPPSNLGGNGSTSRPGVWCSTSVLSPVNCNTRPKTDWRYPVPSVDFNQVSSSLCTMKRTAFADDPATASLANLANACTQQPTTRTPAYLPQRGSFNIARGYLIQLNTDGTYDLYNVNGENDRLTPYTSALTLQSVANNIAVPASGIIFAEDNVWVRTDPTFHGRVNIGAARLATSNNANIVIADDILYTTKNGQDAIGLVAENNILLAPYAPPASGAFNFEVDAATLSQSASIQYPSRYRTDSSRCTRGWTSDNQRFTYYGSVATRQTWTWTWLLGGSCGDAASKVGVGYISGVYNNTTDYDYNMLYAPPPSFPITGGYNILSWREVLTRP
jgi:type II secretory pathway pseudopilin PulG